MGESLHKGYDRSDLDDGKDEFSFTVRFHTKQVDDENGSQENGNKNGFGDVFIPVSDCECASDDLKRKSEEPLETVARPVSDALIS